VLEVLKPLAMPIMRYPGGNFVSAFDWKDGIGPKDKRPVRPEFAWASIETNQFGTDEFMTWCKKLGTAPMMAVNLGTAGATEAAQLLEYCNLPVGTSWADRRKANGHADPYGVKLWCLGNEMDGPWQAGHVPAEEYARRARAAGAMMKGLDPTIETVACGSSARGMATYLEYDRITLEHCWEQVNYISAHRYSANDRQDTPWFLAEGVEIDRVIQDYAGLLDYVRGRMKSNKRVHVSFDEWNVWYKARAGNGGWKQAPHLLEEVYNLEDALVCAQYLSAFIRRADVVKVACIAQIVNVIAPVLTRKEGLLKQSIYYPFESFSQMAKGVSLTPLVRGASYKAGERGEVPSLDASATFDAANGDVNVFLVNRDLTQPLTVEISLLDRTITSAGQATALGGGDPKAANSWENPDLIRPKKATVNAQARSATITVPAPGFAAVTLKTMPA
jgi:alpha-N-arabinofuranosidase